MLRKLALETILKKRRVATNHSRVVEALGRDIIAGRYAVGEILPGDMDLALRFGVSRTVLREAMKTLDAKGLINPRVRVGTSVRPRNEWNHFDPSVLYWYIEAGLEDKLLGQLQEICMMLEPTAAMLAATNGTPQQINAIIRRLDRLVSVVTPAEEVISLLLDLHVAIAEASANVFIQSSEAALKTATVLRIKRNPALAGPLNASDADTYRALSSALQARNSDLARSVMEKIVRMGLTDKA